MLWDVATRAPVGDPLVAGRTLTSVAISDDRALVAATASGGWLHLWDITPAGETTGQVELPFLDGAVASGLDFGADRVVAASSWDHDQTLTVWDEPRERPDDVLTLTLQGEGFTAQGVAFGPDGTTLASAGQTVQVWDLADRQPIIDLLGHDGGVNSVAYGPDGTTLVSGGLFNSEVIAWDLSLEVLIELACREAGRNMTQREWDRFIGTDVAYERTCAAFDSGEGAPASAPVAQYTLPAH